MRINGALILKSIQGVNDYYTAESSFSPFYSNIGLQLDKNKGIAALYLHYNRACRQIFDSTISFDIPFDNAESSVNKLVFNGNNSRACLAFYKTDAFIFESEGVKEVSLFEKVSENTTDIWEDSAKLADIALRGYSNNPDNRDPDRTVPFLLGVRIINGSRAGDEYKITADENGKITFAFSFIHLDFSNDELSAALYSSPLSVDEACRKSEQAFLNCVKDTDVEVKTDKELRIFSRAVLGLYQNLCAPAGNLSGYICQFPNRGAYPTLFLWDTCFQNLAFDILNSALSKDSLLGLAATQRCDGKVGQFNCSTWVRPDYTQPALLGWASLRLIEQTGDLNFAAEILPALVKNNRWWLNHRITKCGLICCPHGLETGQDDSPRFDNGTTISVDMNSYLLNQMRCTSLIAEKINDSETALFWQKKSDEFARLIVKHLYDEENNIFFDIDPVSEKRVKLICSSDILPLWAGVPLEENKIDTMINDYLLNHDHLFGKIPFPSVGYSEDVYESDHWWRGPTWLPIAWLMLETLEKYGKDDKLKEAAERLYNMIVKDGELHELFDSKSGKGLGSVEQGWSCAIFIKLCTHINS